jgi:trans-aconitate 2-methyltransferase
MHKWDPSDYEKSSSAQYRWAMDLVSRLDLSGDERVLDIGCGDGKITAQLASRLPKGEVLGIDLSRDMIDFARDRHPVETHPNLVFQCEDANKLGFNEEFDLVVSFACLHWVNDHLPVLKGIRRSLVPSGRVLLQFGGKGNAAEILAITEDLIREDKWSGYFKGFSFPYHFYGPDEYRVWLRQAGLKARRVDLVPKDMVQTGKKGLEGIIRNTWLPYTERLPETLRPQFVSEITESYIERYPLVEGLAHVRMVRLEIEALK